MKPNYQRAQTAIILIWVSLVMDIIFAFFSHRQIGLLQQGINSNKEFPLSALETNGYILGIIGILSVVIYIVTAVAFLLWFSRAYSNLYTKVENLIFSKSAAVWAWFIPIINLFRPYTIMKEMYRRTDDYIKENGLIKKHIDLSQRKILIWWILWITGNLVRYALSLTYRENDDTIDSLITISWIHIAMSLIIIPSGIYAIKVIKRYAETEELLLKINPEK
ncbi:MAG TPA: DUF4328 domain-containing protein [Flavobacterium sp.]|nr:DUF4328 domain-containing protein [Flavobacterium sp.]